VTQNNLDYVPGIVRWFLANADAFKMVSFQPLAEVGRTDRSLKGVSPDELWLRIAEGAGDPMIRRGEGWVGHPACSRFVQGLAVRRRNGVAFVPLYRRDRTDEMQTLNELLERLGGTSFRLDNRGRALQRLTRIALRHGGFVVSRLVPHFIRLLTRVGSLNANYFCIVSHHFMSAAEMKTAQGQERLDVCAFRCQSMVGWNRCVQLTLWVCVRPIIVESLKTSQPWHDAFWSRCRSWCSNSHTMAKATAP
jgi:hypothetical protein